MSSGSQSTMSTPETEATQLAAAQLAAKENYYYRPTYLPATADEVQVVVLLDLDSGLEPEVVGDLNAKITELPDLLARLGTHVSDGDPSNFGFRFFLRTDPTGSDKSLEAESHYYVQSFEFPKGANIVNRPPLPEDFHFPPKNLFQDLGDYVGNLSEEDFYRELYCIDIASGPSTFKTFTQSSGSWISVTDKDASIFLKARRVRILFQADKVLISHLEKAIKNQHCGVEAPNWKTPLPCGSSSARRPNVQDQMVLGSCNLLNILNRALHEPDLVDGRNTEISQRPKAMKFRRFLQNSYATALHLRGERLFPIFLHVMNSVCTELPFGAHLINRDNTFVVIRVVNDLLRDSFQPQDIGVVTFYPAQAELYVEALKECHQAFPQKGFDRIKAQYLENWVGGETIIVIVDFVRTANASGNLGLLSQAKRLQASLSLHRDGLIIVGDINCTISADGTVTSSKLEKVLRWFHEHQRVVPVDQDGSAVSKQEITKVNGFTIYPDGFWRPMDPPSTTASSDARSLVNRRSQVNSNDKASGKADHQQALKDPRASADASFARQGFVHGIHGSTGERDTNTSQLPYSLHKSPSASNLSSEASAGDVGEFETRRRETYLSL